MGPRGYRSESGFRFLNSMHKAAEAQTEDFYRIFFRELSADCVGIESAAEAPDGVAERFGIEGFFNISELFGVFENMRDLAHPPETVAFGEGIVLEHILAEIVLDIIGTDEHLYCQFGGSLEEAFARGIFDLETAPHFQHCIFIDDLQYFVAVPEAVIKYTIRCSELTDNFTDGDVMCALLHRELFGDTDNFLGAFVANQLSFFFIHMLSFMSFVMGTRSFLFGLWGASLVSIGTGSSTPCAERDYSIVFHLCQAPVRNSCVSLSFFRIFRGIG